MKIVIGYSGSKSANAMLKGLIHSGLPRTAQVRLVRAVPTILPLESMAPDGTGGLTWYADAYREALANHQANLAKAATDTKDAARLLKTYFPAWTIKGEVWEDAPAHSILDIAEKWKADVIVIGSGGWNELGKLIVGSVADKILNHAPCTVRLAKGAARAAKGPVKLLFAYDGSAYADEAIRQMAARSWPKGSEARILAVSEFQLRMGDITLAINKTLGRKNRLDGAWPWIERKLDKAVGRLEKAGLKSTAATVIDEPVRAILDQAKKFKADAIVTGTHGASGMKRFLLGSVSASVAAHAPCTVEVVRARSAKKGTR